MRRSLQSTLFCSYSVNHLQSHYFFKNPGVIRAYTAFRSKDDPPVNEGLILLQKAAKARLNGSNPKKITLQEGIRFYKEAQNILESKNFHVKFQEIPNNLETIHLKYQGLQYQLRKELEPLIREYGFNPYDREVVSNSFIGLKYSLGKLMKPLFSTSKTGNGSGGGGGPSVSEEGNKDVQKVVELGKEEQTDIEYGEYAKLRSYFMVNLVERCFKYRMEKYDWTDYQVIWSMCYTILSEENMPMWRDVQDILGNVVGTGNQQQQQLEREKIKEILRGYHIDGHLDEVDLMFYRFMLPRIYEKELHMLKVCGGSGKEKAAEDAQQHEDNSKSESETASSTDTDINKKKKKLVCNVEGWLNYKLHLEEAFYRLG